MTFFRETFTKDKKEALSYDDSAFLFFASAVLFLILIVWIIIFIRSIYLPLDCKLGQCLSALNSTRNNYIWCSCEKCKNKVISQTKKIKSFSSKIQRKRFLVQCVGLVCLSFLMKILLEKLSTVSEIKTFQPYEILNITLDANEQAIRKAYLRMSLLHHPDRHPNDPLASAKFILITKAYQALTDETSRLNYKKYGNPDGQEVLQIGIGLPQFLVNEEYQLFVLAIFMLILLLGIPLAFILYYQHQKNLHPNGIQIETIQLLGLYLSESTRFKRVVELFAASAESRSLLEIPSERQIIEKISSLLCEKVEKSQFPCPVIERNLILLYGHMERLHDSMSPNLLHDLQVLLRYISGITQSMIEIAFLRNWYRVIRSILTFRRCMVQALLPSSPVLMQVPYYECLTPEIKKKYNGNLLKFAKAVLSTDSESSPLFSALPPNIFTHLRTFCKSLSRLSLNIKIFVQGESKCVENDLLTFEITLTKENMNPNERTGPVHAPYVDNVIFEEWWIFILDKREEALLAHKRCAFFEKRSTHDLHILIPYSGEWKFRVLVMCDSYIGLDALEDVTIKVLSKEDVVRPVIMEPEPRTSEHASGLLQSFFSAETIDDSSLCTED